MRCANGETIETAVGVVVVHVVISFELISSICATRNRQPWFMLGRLLDRLDVVLDVCRTFFFLNGGVPFFTRASNEKCARLCRVVVRCSPVRCSNVCFVITTAAVANGKENDEKDGHIEHERDVVIWPNQYLYMCSTYNILLVCDTFARASASVHAFLWVRHKVRMGNARMLMVVLNVLLIYADRFCSVFFFSLLLSLSLSLSLWALGGFGERRCLFDCRMYVFSFILVRLCLCKTPFTCFKTSVQNTQHQELEMFKHDFVL